jgi:hypothetical protein
MKKSLLTLFCVWLTPFALLFATRYNATTSATLTSAYTSCAAGDTIMLATANYTTSLSITKSVTLKANPGALPVLKQTAITMSTAGQSLALDSVEAYWDADGTSPATDSKYFITATTAVTLPSITLKNCKIHGWGRGVIRSDGSSAFCTINSILVNNCLFYEIGGGNPSYPVFGVKSALIASATITNSTFYNCMCAVWRSTETATPIIFRMENCTMLKMTSNSSLGVTAANSTGLIAASAKTTGASTYTIKNCVISDSYDGTTTQMTINVGTGTFVTANLDNVLLGNNMGTITGTYSPDTRLTTTALTYSYAAKTITTTPSYYTMGDPRWMLNPVPATITSVTAPSSSICATATQTLTANGVAGNNAVCTWWTATNGTGSNLGTGTTLSNVGPGTYFARVTASYGTPVEASITVTATANPSISVQPVSPSGSFVQGGSATDLSITATGDNLTYHWFSSTDNSIATSSDDVAVGTNASTYTPSTATIGTLYYYCVVTGPCVSATSTVAAVSIAAADVPVIHLDSGSAALSTSAGLAITDIVYSWGGSATGISITWSGSSTVKPDGIDLTTDNLNKTLKLSGTPVNAGTYSYAVKATDGSTFSSESTGSITVKLATPVLTSSDVATNQGFTAHWNDVSGESGYAIKIYQSTTLISTISDIASNATSRIVTGLNPNTTYEYTITATGDGSLIPASNESSKSTSIRTLSVSKAITTFTVTGQLGSIINETAKTVTVLIPYGTDKSSLTPSAITVSDLATVSPAASLVQNFNSPVTYTVTAEDGSQQSYVISAKTGSQATDYFRSKASGSWDDVVSANVWESSVDNAHWYEATLAPGATSSSVVILSGHTITLGVNASVGNVTISNGGSLKTTGTAVLTIGSGKALTVNGTLENNGSATSNLVITGATVTFGPMSTYLLSGTSLYVPAATYDVTSTVNITGMTTGGNMVSTAGTVYGNLVVNSPDLTGTIVLFPNGSPMQRVAGNLTVISTGTTGMAQLLSSGGTNILAIDGNFTQNAGIVLMNPSSYAATTFRPVVVKGNFILNGGTFRLANSTNASGASNCYLIVKGESFALNNTAVLDNIANPGSGGSFVHLAGSRQTFTRSATSSIVATVGHTINFVVNSGTTLDLGSSVIDGSANVNVTTKGAFTISDLVANTTANSNTVTISNSVSLASVQPGMLLTGGSIPANTYVTAVLSATDLQISKAATATATGVSVVLSGADAVTLQTSHASGIDGNIAVGGTKSLSAATNYVFNGMVAQTTGASLLNAGVISMENKAGVSVNASLNASLINVAPTSSLTLLTGNTLTVPALNLQSNANSTATFVNNGTLVCTASTIAQALSANRDWYVSSPLSNATRRVFGVSDAVNNQVLAYDEVANTWPKMTDSTASLIPVKGYVAHLTNPTNVTFTGTFNNGDLSIALTTSTSDFAGYNLVGNPYPSYLDWQAVSTANPLVSSSIWYRTRTIGNFSVFATYNAVGNVAVSNGAISAVTKLVPPMQGFWVLASSATTLNLTNAMRSHADVTTNKLKSADISNTLLRIRVSNGVNSDETVLYANAGAINGYDRFDSPKMFNNNVAVPEIYTMADNQKVVINGLNELNVNQRIPLAFTTAASGSFSLQANELTNLDSNLKLKLVDQKLGKEIDLTDGEAYAFSSEAVTTADRFSLVLRSADGTTGVDNEQTQRSAVVYRNSSNQIEVHAFGVSQVSVYNTLGQLVAAQTMDGNSKVVATTLGAGVYLVRVTNAGTTLTSPVILK